MSGPCTVRRALLPGASYRLQVSQTPQHMNSRGCQSLRGDIPERGETREADRQTHNYERISTYQDIMQAPGVPREPLGTIPRLVTVREGVQTHSCCLGLRERTVRLLDSCLLWQR